MKQHTGKNSDSVMSRGSAGDVIKWSFSVILVIAGLWANYHYREVDWALRLAGWIVLGCVILVIASQTGLGRQIWAFAKNARGELRKVFWPTRQETVQTTLIVVGMVVLTALVLWGIDSVLLWLVGWLTGQRG